MKRVPRRPKNPIVWSKPIAGGGIWATPAIHRNALFVTTNSGKLLAVGRAHGRIAWDIQLAGPTWSSPVVADDTLVVGDCNGVLRAYDVADPLAGRPSELWKLSVPGCVESTPAEWKGMIYVGTRGGGIYEIGDRL